MRALKRIMAVLGLLLFIFAITYITYTAKQVDVKDIPKEDTVIEQVEEETEE